MGTTRALGRVFTEDKFIDSRALNAAGVHPFRILTARLVYGLRRSGAHPMLADLRRDGIAVHENFLPQEDFELLCREAEAYIAAKPVTWEYQDGTSSIAHYALLDADPDSYPQLSRWPSYEPAVSLMAAAERRTLRPRDGLRVLEHIEFGDNSLPDSQNDLHVDTFFNTHKVWLYLDDITPESAPLVYVPGSHRPDVVRLRRELQESKATNRGSRRVADDEVEARGLERHVYTCPKNTLVAVNTHGYHCRSVGTDGASRRALHMSFRFNPFSFRAR
jgi:hypothetical protein